MLSGKIQDRVCWEAILLAILKLSGSDTKFIWCISNSIFKADLRATGCEDGS